MATINVNHIGDLAEPGADPQEPPVPEHCPTCGRRLGAGDVLRKCGQCGQWLCESGERALSCTGWIYCPLCRTMARTEWLEAGRPLLATT